MLKLLLFIVVSLGSMWHAVGQADHKKLLAEQLVLLQKSAADTNRVNILIKLSETYLNTPEKINGADSALFYAAAAESLSIKLKYPKGLGDSYIAFSRIWGVKKDKAKGKAYVNKAILVLKDAQLYTALGYAWFELSGFYDLTGDELTERIKLVEYAVAAFKKDNNIKKEADGLKELADVRQIQGNFKQAYSELKHSLQLRQSIHDTDLMGVYDLLCDVATSLGNLNEAVQYGLLAVQLAEKKSDSAGMQLCTIYNHLAITYYYQSDMEAAAAYFDKALRIAKKNKSIDAITNITFSYGNILSRLNRHAGAVSILKDVQQHYGELSLNAKINVTCGFITNYCALGYADSAAPYYDRLKVLSVEKGLPNEVQRSIYYASIAYMLATKQYKKARPLLVAQEKYLTKNSTLLLLAHNQSLWFKLDSAEGNYFAAIEHYKKYKILYDSIYTQAKSKQIAQLKIQYETDQKDRDILLKEKNIELLTKQALLQQTNLRQAQLLRNISVAGAVLLLIIIGLLYNQYRLKQKSSQQINQQNISLQRMVVEKEWLLKEIHHRVKNNFHMVMGLLGTQSVYLKNEEAVNTMEESRHRIHAMSLIHQKLYQSSDFSAISMREYVHELADYLRDSFDTKQRVLFKMDIEDIELGLTHSIPLGLILNEAITNSIKYAFPGHAEGIITITLKHTGIQQLELTIHDSGIGVAAGFDASKNATMGMNLMQGLSEDISGTFTIEKSNGTLIRIVFPVNGN